MSDQFNKSSVKNVHACLVHEKPECVLDLVRNLQALDPASQILLYNGGTDQSLLTQFPFDKMHGVHVIENASPKSWGWLHDFALDCMNYALEHLEFDCLTIVDSDQLAINPGYSTYLEGIIYTPNLGMLVNNHERLGPFSEIDPVKHAYTERELWQPYLDSLPNGNQAFLHWTFWPSTVFTRACAEQLTALFQNDKYLQELLSQTTIWASEEVLFPTLSKALGFNLLPNPCSFDYIKYQQNYDATQMSDALARSECFFAHPIPREIDHPLRKQIAGRFAHYPSSTSTPNNHVTNLQSISTQLNSISGWLTDCDINAILNLFVSLDTKQSYFAVDTGGYHGKNAICLQLAAKCTNIDLRTLTIETAATNILHQNLFDLSFTDRISSAAQFSSAQHGYIDILFVDDQHSHYHVARDFNAHCNYLSKGGHIIFHDFNDRFPGVQSFVRDLLDTNDYRLVSVEGSVAILENLKHPKPISSRQTHQSQFGIQATKPKNSDDIPKVICIMPTADRPQFVKRSIELFMAQDYDNAELLILDDGEQSIKDIRQSHAKIEYLRFETRMNLGEKRNLACDIADGSILVHWDDDDWYHPNWVSSQVQTLLDNTADICGLSNPYFYSPKLQQAWQYQYPQGLSKPWVHGATLAFYKEFWQNNPFPEISIGEDCEFLWSETPKKIASNNFSNGYIGQIHSDNTSPKYTADPRWQHTCPKIADKLAFAFEIP